MCWGPDQEKRQVFSISVEYSDGEVISAMGVQVLSMFTPTQRIRAPILDALQCTLPYGHLVNTATLCCMVRWWPC